VEASSPENASRQAKEAERLGLEWPTPARMDQRPRGRPSKQSVWESLLLEAIEAEEWDLLADAEAEVPAWWSFGQGLDGEAHTPPGKNKGRKRKLATPQARHSHGGCRIKHQMATSQLLPLLDVHNNHGLETHRELRGARPRVRVSRGTCKPPMALFPPDAEVTFEADNMQQEDDFALASLPTWHMTVAEQLQAAGITEAPAWAGLGEIPEELMSGEFKTLLIIGESGSGKTTLLKKLLGKITKSNCDRGLADFDAICLNVEGASWTWDEGKALVEAFQSIETGKRLLGRVGLKSVPLWLKPFHVLSEGEKHKANLARALEVREASPHRPMVIDEWTSDVDRGAAMPMCITLHKFFVAEAKEHPEAAPCIIATCHDDVAPFLNLEMVCTCEIGKAPRVSVNPNASRTLALEAVLLGTPSIAAPRGNDDDLIGCWNLHGSTFSLRPRPSLAYGLTFQLAGAAFAENKTGDQLVLSKERGYRWYVHSTSKAAGASAARLRVRRVSCETLVIQRWQQEIHAWGPEQSATRVKEPFSAEAQLMTRDPDRAFTAAHTPGASGGVSYSDVDLEKLRSAGWYIPAYAMTDDSACPGLSIADGWPASTAWSKFLLNEDEEAIEDEPHYLAAYVGSSSGSVSADLRKAASVMDHGFNGMSVHKIHPLPPLGDFTVGVVTGRCGSGKSTLVERHFGSPRTPSWVAGVAVAKHFPSLSTAKAFCGAACLPMPLAMRCFNALSAGERSRANVARLLFQASSSKSDVESSIVVLEEFTSFVDDATAARMATGLQQLVKEQNLKVVVVTPNRNLISAGRLEPQWMFDCETSYLWRFDSSPKPDIAQLKEQMQKVAAQEKEAREQVDKAKALLMSAAGGLSDPLAGLADITTAVLGPKTDELRRCTTELRIAEKCLALRQAAEEGCNVVNQHVHTLSDLRLEVRRALPCLWRFFRQHHYKDHTLKGDSVVFIALLHNIPVGFLAVTMEATRLGSNSWPAGDEYPHTWTCSESSLPRRLFREHRTVILPEYQAIGLGPLLCDTVARYYHELGHDFLSLTVHPSYGSYRDSSEFWRPLPSNKVSKGSGNARYSHFFVGATQPDGAVDAEVLKRLNARTKLARGALGSPSPCFKRLVVAESQQN